MFLGKRSRSDTDRAIQELAKGNHRNPTDAEKILWRLLRRHTLNGFKFRRQHKIDRFIADFVCIEKKLIIDEERTGVLRKLGF